MPYPNAHFSAVVDTMICKRAEWTVDFYLFAARHPGDGRTSMPSRSIVIDGLVANVRALCSAVQADAVILNGVFSPRVRMLGIVSVIARSNRRKVIVISEGFKRPSFARAVRPVVQFLINRHSVTLLAVGRGAQDDFRRLGLTNWRYTDFGYSQALPPATSIPRESASVRILMVGSLIARKNHKSVLRALDALALPHDVVVTIAGEGPLRQDLQKETDSRSGRTSVRLLGRLSELQLAQEYARSDIFVHPSNYDGWGVVLNHALQFGLPIICSEATRSGRGFLVLDGENGFVYSSEEELNACLRLLISDPSLRMLMGERSLGLWSEWSVDALAERLGQVLAATL